MWSKSMAAQHAELIAFLGGLILFGVGLGLIYVPAGLIGSGVVIMAVAIFGPGRK